MNRTDLEARYPLIRPLAGEGANTHLARSTTGAIVMVHFLDAPVAAWRGGILTRLSQVDPDRRERILEVVDVDGRAVVVTRFLMDFRSFPTWFGGDEAAVAASEQGTDEFERLFGRAAAPPLDALTSDPAVAPGGVAPIPPPTPPADDTPPTEGSFPALSDLGMRSAAGEATLPPSRSPAPAAPREAAPPPAGPAGEEMPPTITPSAGPGEFTREFMAAASAAVPPAAERPREEPVRPPASGPAAPPPASPPLLESAPPPAEEMPPTVAPPTVAPPTVAPPAPPAGAEMPPTTTAAAGPGEFTREFMAAASPAEPPAAEPPREEPVRPSAPSPAAPRSAEMNDRTEAPAADEPGEFTRMFRAAQAPASGGEMTAGTGEARQPRDDAPAGSQPAAPSADSYSPPSMATNSPSSVSAGRDQPGEFTRMFRAARPPEESAPRVTGADATPSTPPPSWSGPASAVPPSASAREGQAATPPAAEGGLPHTSPVAPPPAEGASSPPSGGEPGEFTRMFRAASPPPPALPPSGPAPAPPLPPSVGAPPSSPAGEFTRMFQKLGGAPPPPPPATPAPQAPLWPSDSASGDVYRDRLFQNSPATPPPAASAPSQAPPTPPRVSVDPELPPLPAHMAPPAPPPPATAGEYTRMMSAHAPPPEFAPPRPPAIPPLTPAAPPGMAGAAAAVGAAAGLPTAPPQPPRPRIGLAIGLTAVVAMAIMLILYLVMRAGNASPPDEAATDTVPAVVEAPAAP